MSKLKIYGFFISHFSICNTLNKELNNGIIVSVIRHNKLEVNYGSAIVIQRGNEGGKRRIKENEGGGGGVGGGEEVSYNTAPPPSPSPTT